MTNLTHETLFSSNTQPENERLALLKQHFPNCFDKNGAFLPEKMAEELHTKGVATQKEGYSLNWLGKSYAKVLRDTPPETLLAENIEHNQKPENVNSENLLIKGDNLEVLKHLKHAYQNQIKMIYIDPPYNTGSDGFVYQDDRKFTPEQLAQLGGMDLDEAKRVLEFTAKKSNSHSAWLTFMYPRLYIARELLRDDGVIFISIDDNEQAQLKILCDEVFGAENFVGQICNINNPKGRSDQKNIATAHEYIFIYQKTSKTELKGFKAEENITKRYNKEDDLGVWREIDLRKTGDNDLATDRPNMFYPFYWNKKSQLLSLEKQENSIEIYPMKDNEIKGCWRWGIDTAQQKIELLFARYMPNKKQWSIFEKDYFDTQDFVKSTSVWDFKDVNSERGTELFVKHLKFHKDIFPKPKPLGTIQRCMSLGATPNDLILDFFSGSGTTAHAVMQLNTEDNGNRRFICVQLPEKTDEKSEAFKAGYKTIFDITKARIEKAAAKIQIQAENPDYSGDLGFKIFQTEPNFQAALDADFCTAQAEIPDSKNAMLSDEQLHTLLTTWRVYDGCRLPENVQLIDLAGYTAYYCRQHLYLLASGFSSECVKALIEKLDNDKDFVPERIVLFSANIESAMQKELAQAVKTYANKKGLNNLSVLARY